MKDSSTTHRDGLLMTRVPMTELSLLDLDGAVVPMTDIVRRTTLLIFLRHLG
jgi:hypothetical protein